MANFKNFPLMVQDLVKPGVDIVEEMTPSHANMIHMLLGITGEVGELVDAIKKHTIYGKPLDRLHVIEELGDLEFYLEGLRQELRISRETVLAANMAKLGKRYHTGNYTNEQAIERKDKG